MSSKLQVVCCMSYVVRLIRALQHIHTARVAAEAEAQLKMVWATLAASFDNCQLPNRGNVQRATCSSDSFSRLFSSLVLSLSSAILLSPCSSVILLAKMLKLKFPSHHKTHKSSFICASLSAHARAPTCSKAAQASHTHTHTEVRTLLGKIMLSVWELGTGD